MSSNKKVLIVDDEEDITEILTAMVKDQGFDATSVLNAEDALELYKVETFNLIIVDILLPNMNGIDLTREIVSKNPDQKVVVMTGGGESREDIVKAILLHEGQRKGAIHTLSKPFNNSDLIEILKDI